MSTALEQMSLELPAPRSRRDRFDDGTYPDGFWEWLDDNEHVLTAFIEIALEAKRRKFRRWSADAICHVLRWQTAVREGGESKLKINDHATAGLARLARELHPELRDFFKTRRPPARAEARRLDGKLYREGAA